MFPVVLYQYTPPLFFKGLNGNKVTQLLCVIPAIAPYGERFYSVFTFNEFIFVYVENIGFIGDGEIYLLTYLQNITYFQNVMFAS